MASEDEKFAFVVEWYDPLASLVRQYILYYYDHDTTIEMYDVKNRRSFLRRCKAENVRLCDMFIGSTLNIMSRQLKFVDYGDEYTRRRLGLKKERTFGFIKPDALPHRGKILDMIWKSGLQITQLKMIRMNRQEASEFYGANQCTAQNGAMVELLTSGPIVAIEMRGENAVSRWLDLLGPADSSRARQCAPSSIRARFGTDCVKNAAHGSESPETAMKEMEFFLPTEGLARMNSACYLESTCAVIKPHAILDGVAGDIVDKILDCGFEISAMWLLTLEKANAEEFYEVYKGVVQEYPMMVNELSSGPCIAMEIRAKDAAKTFREFVGPADPEIARHLRPRTLRALFGRTKSHNAVHCTDLPEDAQLEVEYFFKILDQ